MQLKLIIDLLFTCGIITFLWSCVRQLQKILRTRQTKGISLTHYYIKTAAILCMIVGYILSALPISLAVSIFELSVTLISINRICIYRWGRFEWKKLLK